MKNQNFMNFLVLKKILTEDDVKKLRIEYSDDTYEILKHLKKKGGIDKNILGKLWGDSIGVSYVELSKTLFQPSIIKKLPQDLAKKHKMIPLYEIEGTVTIATANPMNLDAIKDAESLIGKKVSMIFSFPEEIEDSIEVQYQSKEAISGLMNNIMENAFAGSDKITPEELKAMAGDKALVEFCRAIMLLGIKEKASDIHIESQEKLVRIRFRVDGVLNDRIKLSSELISPIASCMKVMAGLDITEKRRPQDGRFSLDLSNRSIDFRFSSIPTIHGEKMVLRILGQAGKQHIPTVEQLGLSQKNIDILKKIIDTPNGVFFVTGPTGSGKTTTLFSVLQHLNEPEVNIMTAEDPVEYKLPGVNQVQINPGVELNFASILRSFLRQDPDVILIGEIRDLETAKIASQAALTGHLVLATMHTNNSLQAVTRLVEIGVEPFLVAPSIIGVMAQRLVRQICPKCKESYEPDPSEIERYFIWNGQKKVTFYKGKGCLDCNHTGYTGRVAIHEIFIMTEEIRSMVAKNVSIIEIEKKAKQSGFETLRYDGLKKVLRGLTTIDELERVTAADM
ncbi:MAG: GspE/PulE family protein [Proteobacteria bacterium]|nr:GspE/PulE family protein [Pseudomonadota bacterium]